jgi:histidine phosphotransferase ChpT
MAQSELDLSALISSRICHDLISPIGAINNGLELLGMSGLAPEGPEMSLISESVMNASARIRFFRIAFGAASDQEIGRTEVLSVLNDMMQNSRLSVDWAPLEGQPRNMVRLAFLAILCLESAMPYGGQIKVSASHAGWKIHGTSEKFNDIDDLWAHLRADVPSSEVSSAHVQFELLPSAAKALAKDLQLVKTENEITISF